MERQMFFEEFMSPKLQRREHRQLPSEQRDAVVGLLSELMGRTLAGVGRDAQEEADTAPGTDAKEGCKHD